jgi:hypothetical protein
MRVPAETLLANRLLRIDEIEKHKGFDHLADVRRADHADDWPVRAAARAEYDAATCPDIGGGLSVDDGTHEALSKYLTCHFGGLEMAAYYAMK